MHHHAVRSAHHRAGRILLRRLILGAGGTGYRGGNGQNRYGSDRPD